MANNYYELLGIELTSDMQVIKDAYTKKVRKHAQDANSDIFQLVQQAYATLTDVKKKYAHDIEVMYGPKIETLRNEASRVRKDKQYDKAHVLYQQLLEYFPQDDVIHNYNGIALDAIGEYTRAIQSFERAIALNDDEPVYYMNLAMLYEDLEDMQKAIRLYKQAILVAPKDFQYVNRLANVYMRLDDYDSAWQLVEKALNKPYIEGKGKMLYIKKLVEIAILMSSSFEMQIAFKYVEKFAAQGDEQRNDAVEVLYNFSLELARESYYKPALTIIRTLKQITPHDDDVNELYDNIERKLKIEEEIELLAKDEDIFGPLRYRAYLYYYYDEIEDAESETDEVNDRIWQAAEHDPYMLKTSIQRMKRQYPTIVDGMDKWFSIVEEIL
ncbi:tetratricopeptide repeat protein [Caryophanon latum]|uniref:J domain-containing protein n=1 Tax=Caryophanon latum TaxID=33977 RepID=A0A1C0YVB1_9BACL|nr:tetratricopeptide repeat protein [Caryophanon latum]OCS91110.1 hypothetical protein A6K76_10220 [Caryophanon latum]